jgi:hypothetical protein
MCRLGVYVEERAAAICDGCDKKSQREMSANTADTVVERGRKCQGSLHVGDVGVKVLCEASRWWVLK